MDVFGEHLLAAAGLAVQNDGAVHRGYMIGILQQFHHGITLRDDHGWSFVSALHEANDVADVVPLLVELLQQGVQLLLIPAVCRDVLQLPVRAEVRPGQGKHLSAGGGQRVVAETLLLCFQRLDGRSAGGKAVALEGIIDRELQQRLTVDTQKATGAVADIEKTAPVIRDQHAAEVVLRQDLQQLIFLLSCGG